MSTTHANLSSKITEENIIEAIDTGKFSNLEELYNLVGYPGIANLIEYYNGDSIYIPKGTAVILISKHMKMYDYYMECRDYKKTAKAFDVTVKTAHNVIGSIKRRAK